MKKIYILIGAKPNKNNMQHAGGQITASIGLAKYAEKNGFKLTIIDTTQSGFPVPSFRERLIKGGSRLKKLLNELRSFEINGVIIFAGHGFSFCERICMSLLCRLYNVNDILFVRSGFFRDSVNNASNISTFLVKCALKIPSYIGAQGLSWIDFYSLLGVDTEKLVLVRNWIPHDYSVVTAPKEVAHNQTLTFVYVGWLVVEKGIIELLDAIDSLYSSFDFKLIFVGGGTLDGLVNERIRNNKMTSRIMSLGWQNNEEVKNALSCSHVFVLPSYSEGFPNALLEAMAMGLPAICSDVGAISDSLHNDVNGYLIPPKNSRSLASAMEKYLLNKEFVKLHSQATLNIISLNHDWEQNCKKLFEAFERQ